MSPCIYPLAYVVALFGVLVGPILILIIHLILNFHPLRVMTKTPVQSRRGGPSQLYASRRVGYMSLLGSLFTLRGLNRRFWCWTQRVFLRKPVYCCPIASVDSSGWSKPMRKVRLLYAGGKLLPFGEVVVPLVDREAHKAAVISINNHPMEAMVDTGCTYTRIERTRFRELGL